MKEIFQKAKQSLVDFVRAAPPSVRIGTGISLATGAVALTAKGIRTYAALSPEINQILTTIDALASIATLGVVLGGNLSNAAVRFFGHYWMHGLNPGPKENCLYEWSCTYWCGRPLGAYVTHFRGLNGETRM